MKNVVNLDAARAERVEARRRAIVEVVQNPDIPGRDYVNAATGEAHLDEVGLAYFRGGLRLFGVVGLDPEPPANFDKLMATWATLLTVGVELLAEARLGAGVNDLERRIWHPAYAAYVDALLAGDDASVRRGAAALGLASGVEKETAMLWRGPVGSL